MATMNSQCTTKPTPKAINARIASKTKSSISNPPSTGAGVQFPFETRKRQSVGTGYARTLTSVEGAEEFSPEERERARAYHGPLYLALLADAVLAAGVLAALAWSSLGDWLFSPLESLPAVAAAAVYAAFVVTLSTLIRTPLAFWRGWWREREWGFSAQGAGGWLADRSKGLAVSVVLSAGAWAAAVALARALPGWWAVPAGAALALALLLLSFVAPVVLEPIFNRFRPLDDEALTADLRGLSQRAGVPVRDVLVADASRRTTKVNAYVSGIGRTRRVVLFDTLLEAAGRAEVRVVVAHELGHRRDRHVVKLTALAMLGALIAVAVLWAVLGTRVADPRTLPEALLLLFALEVASLPGGAWLSRRYERAADRCSLDLTEEPAAFTRAHVELARRNLSDLEPPRLVYVLLFSHPTPPERLAIGRAWREAHA
jgi:STE24 endopeptidase